MLKLRIKLMISALCLLQLMQGISGYYMSNKDAKQLVKDVLSAYFLKIITITGAKSRVASFFDGRGKTNLGINMVNYCVEAILVTMIGM